MDPKRPQQPTDAGPQSSRAEGRQRLPLENDSLLELQLTGEGTIQEGSSGYPTLPSSGYLPDHFSPEQRVEHAENVDLSGLVAKSEEVNAAEAMLTLSQTPVVDPKGIVASVGVNHPEHQRPMASLEGDASLNLPSQLPDSARQDIPDISAAELSQLGASVSGPRSPIPQQDNPADPTAEEDVFDHSRLEEGQLRGRIRAEEPIAYNVGNLEELISHFDAPASNQFHKRCHKCNMRPFTYEQMPFWCKVNWELEINGLKIPCVDYGQPVFFVNKSKTNQYFGQYEKKTNRDLYDEGPSTSFG
ncbi:uncharacterized protein [Euwallacea fornicatus]|uniref:uncharacterized protein n=1 Tax=Euwallacea fornicatus TaxID=995702 RepID=UPI00338F684F